MTQLRNNSTLNLAVSLAVAVTMAGLLSGCSKMGAHNDMGQSQVREQPASPVAQRAIHTIGETSETLYDDVKAEEWQKASDKLPTLNQAKEELKASQQAKGADQYVDRLSTDLGKQIGQQDRIQAMESANELTRASMDLGAPPEATMPKELSLLDYFGRELEIGAIAKDKGKMSGAAKDIKHTWLSLKPKVDSHLKSSDSSSEKAQFEQLLNRLDKANSEVEYQQIATQLLEHVDKLESMFSKG